MVYKYDEEEWANVVPKDADWSRKETDYLIALCQQFDLRFLVVADRYEVRVVQLHHQHCQTKSTSGAWLRVHIVLLLTCHALCCLYELV
jgi:hypothetical protein